MTEKVADEAKKISLAAASAACRAALSLGAADALMIAGLMLFVASAWIRGRIDPKDHLQCD
jgi:hypothetical protein